MKIGVYLEGSPIMGGGFLQSLKATTLLFSDPVSSNVLIPANILPMCFRILTGSYPLPMISSKSSSPQK